MYPGNVIKGDATARTSADHETEEKEVTVVIAIIGVDRGMKFPAEPMNLLPNSCEQVFIGTGCEICMEFTNCEYYVCIILYSVCREKILTKSCSGHIICAVYVLVCGIIIACGAIGS